MTLRHALLAIALAAGTQAQAPLFTSFDEVKPVLSAIPELLTPELKDPGEQSWTAWSRDEDRIIRRRLDQGDLDSLINLLWFGTSFTERPRIDVRALLKGEQAEQVQGRIRDLLQAVQSPGANERLQYLRELLRQRDLNPDTADGYRKTGQFMIQTMGRVLEEQIEFSRRIDSARQANDPTTEFVQRSQLFRDRGVSLDTSLLPGFGIEQTLRDMLSKNVLRKGAVRRVAVIGPGLDFIDKESGYDYYPQQTLQPFSIFDTLARLGLASKDVRVTVLDISARVLDHLRRARQAAQKGQPYVIQLPRDPAQVWSASALQYWETFGERIGFDTAPLQPPPLLQALKARAVQVRPSVVLSCQGLDLNIVFQREVAPGAQYDLIIATNVLVYYDTLRQTLALRNIAAMLRPGGFFLTNANLRELPGIPIHSAGYTTVRYGDGAEAGDHFVWYRKQ